MRWEKIYFDGVRYYTEPLRATEDVIYAVWLFEKMEAYWPGLYVGYKSLPVSGDIFASDIFTTAFVLTDFVSPPIEIDDGDKNIVYRLFGEDEMNFYRGIPSGWYFCIEPTKTLMPSKTYAVLHIFTDYTLAHVKAYKLEATLQEHTLKSWKRLNAYIDIVLAGFWRYDARTDEEKMIVELNESIAWCYERFLKACQDIRYRCTHKEEFIDVPTEHAQF